MLDWSKSYETYLGLSEKQRLGIGRKANEIIFPEISALADEEFVRPALYLMSLAPFVSLQEENGKKEYEFIKSVIGYDEDYERFAEVVSKAKEGKIAKFLSVYFEKLGGQAYTAYLSMGLAIVTIKGEVTEEDRKLFERQ